jgi:hypothetical protein
MVIRMAENTLEIEKAARADAVVQHLGEHLRTMPLPQIVRNEDTLDRAIRGDIRRYVAAHIPGAKVFTH